jgi:hypothetical protein
MPAASSASAGFRFAVEPAKLLEFVDALGDSRPLFRSRAAARAAGSPAIPAPIAFTRSIVFQDPDTLSVNAAQILSRVQARR